MRQLCEVACFLGGAAISFLTFLRGEFSPALLTAGLAVAVLYWLTVRAVCDSEAVRSVYRSNTGMLVVAPFLSLIWRGGFVVAVLLVAVALIIAGRALRGEQPRAQDWSRPFTTGH
ncbi:hypothetical protein [Actinomyces sp. MRS3W]|uniref:hypothetical protein n=1 Tax=Actinomyces sp. MRS3W TaxID=2800796 RepID=UPI0028FD5E3E|nr:hypothetical protein [Actinomyces sp. MRS3W]MDU0349447.1 hypothetical protein [Actinomyces sp. MRS3W]